MRRFAVPGVALGLLLWPATGAGIAAPQPTCASDPSFGVVIDEEARALGALDGIYVDGAVAVPIRLGLGVASIQRPSDLVDRGLVSFDVTGPNGAGLPGKLELAVATQPTPGVGRAAWLIWVGQQPFEPNTSYELEYSFANDEVSMCPEAVPAVGILPFSTGESSAKSELDGVSLSFASTLLYPQLKYESNCCSAPESEPCLSEGKCVACWTSFYSVGKAQAVVTPTLPVSYFAIDVSLLAGDAQQPILPDSGGGSVFLVDDSAPEYCFEARLRPRAPVDAAVSTSACLGSADMLQASVTHPYAALPLADCAEPPQLSQIGPYDVVQAMFGKTREEAQLAILELNSPPGTGVAPVTQPIAPTANGERGACTAARGGTGSSAAAWAIALLLLARRRH